MSEVKNRMWLVASFVVISKNAIGSKSQRGLFKFLVIVKTVYKDLEN